MNETKPFILTPDCVMAVGKVVDEKDHARLLGMSLTFRKLLSGELDEHIIYDGHISRFRLPDNSTYSAEFLKKAKAIISEIKYDGGVELWQRWDVKKRCYIKNHPVMLRNDDLGIVIAPILDNREW